ncbi:High-affinity proline transporter PutP [Methanocorpusculaceae archaeon Sp1]|uniref:High-affinity proline transporter PutP n=1 Tax=Methanorbis furvi TaxID=3028299 RepID=A0AAE4MBU3_9EURY|nr:High-affinity proline transporter PutP [Methanocorpusculaceae archaeon Sp1]MDV0441102.1 High-affinity proline transporter PutP [Methanocorpusculaceae archaeon Ag1]
MLDWNLIGIGAAFIIYFAAMIYIGFFYFKKTKTTSDYVLGGRKLHPFVAAMSAEASDMSGWLLLGLPGLAYATGMSAAGWTAIGLAIGTYLNWKFIAKRLRIYTHKAKDSLTIPEFITNRFNEKRGFITAIASVFILIFFIVYTSAQFKAGGVLFSSLMTIYGVDLSSIGITDVSSLYIAGVLVCALIVVCYTFTGGFKAVCITDTIQGLLMLFALILVPIVACIILFGDGITFATAGINPEMFSLFHQYDAASGVFEFVSVFTIVSGLAWGFGYFGQPHILPRFMAIENPEEVPKARMAAMVWVILSLSAAIFVGLIGQLMFPDPAALGGNPEQVFIQMTGTVFGALPFIAGIIYCGILGAVMSTASSQLLVASSSISQDIYKNLINKSAPDKRLLMISRVTVLAVSAIAIILALNQASTVFNIVANAWAGFGCTFGTVILLGLFWKRMNWQGALAGIIVGGVVSLGWGTYLAGPTGLYEMVPGVIASLIAIYVVSKLTAEPEKEITDLYDEYVAEIGDRST